MPALVFLLTYFAGACITTYLRGRAGKNFDLFISLCWFGYALYPPLWLLVKLDKIAKKRRTK